MRSTIKDMTLYNILNMENLLDGGLKTEFGLYALAILAESGKNGFPDQAAHILAKFTNINLKQLNLEHDTNQANHKQILWAMFDVANAIVKADPKLKDDVRLTMKIIRDNNPEIPEVDPEKTFLMNLGIEGLWQRTIDR